LEEFEADQTPSDAEERFVDVGASFVADTQSPVLVKPADGAFDDPALFAKPGAVVFLGPRDRGGDAADTQLGPAAARMVGAVSE
jgi:hypothetical protein